MLNQKTSIIISTMVAATLFVGCGAPSPKPASYTPPKVEAKKPAKPKAKAPEKKYSDYLLSEKSNVNITSLEKSGRSGDYVPKYEGDVFFKVSAGSELKGAFLVSQKGELYHHYSSGFSNVFDKDGNKVSSTFYIEFTISDSENKMKLVLPNKDVIEIDASSAKRIEKF